MGSKRSIRYGLVILGIICGVYLIYKKAIELNSPRVNLVKTSTWPISSTFVMPDMRNSDFDGLMSELRSVGIDTIIINFSESKSTECGVKFKDTYYLDGSAGVKGNSWSALTLSALAHNMKIFFGPRGQMVDDPCYDVRFGNPNDPNTPMGHALSHLDESISRLKAYLDSIGVAWNDTRIAGIYIPEEILTRDYAGSDITMMRYFIEASNRLSKYGKPTLISPGQLEETDYTASLQAYKNLIANTNISIIAPQDSVGTGYTKTIDRSRDHFRALSDAKAAYPQKNVAIWGNIELFQSAQNDPSYSQIPGKYVQYIPADIERVKRQIDVIAPYVSKITSWNYQHYMMTLASAQNLSQTLTWNYLYTPDLASRRAKLKQNYVAIYSGGSSDRDLANCQYLFYYEIQTKSCQKTSAQYVNGIECGGSRSCEQNLQQYLSGRTTNSCYTSAQECSSKNAINIASPIPSKTPELSSSNKEAGSASSDPRPSPNYLMADVNTDNTVNEQDLSLVEKNYGKTSFLSVNRVDVNRDGIVNILDYNLILANYNR